MTEPNRQSGENEQRIIEIEIERLRPFKEHPFQVKDDKEMFLLQESIEKYGILNPLIVRPVPDGYYEIISGHRRKHAAEKLGYRKVPVIIRVLGFILAIFMANSGGAWDNAKKYVEEGNFGGKGSEVTTFVSILTPSALTFSTSAATTLSFGRRNSGDRKSVV